MMLMKRNQQKNHLIDFSGQTYCQSFPFVTFPTVTFAQAHRGTASN
jgi:hypothetical protein